MRKILALVAALLAVLVPNRIVDGAERLAFEDPDAGRLRSWTLPMARLEGLVVCWLLVRHPAQTTILKRPLSVLGLAMALVPRQSLSVGLELAYENRDELEVKPWIGPATRLLGAVYVVVGLAAVRATGRSNRRRTTDE